MNLAAPQFPALGPELKGTTGGLSPPTPATLGFICCLGWVTLTYQKDFFQDVKNNWKRVVSVKGNEQQEFRHTGRLKWTKLVQDIDLWSLVWLTAFRGGLVGTSDQNWQCDVMPHPFSAGQECATGWPSFCLWAEFALFTVWRLFTGCARFVPSCLTLTLSLKGFCVMRIFFYKTYNEVHANIQ